MFKLINFQLPLKIVGHGRSYPMRKLNNIELLNLTPQFSGKSENFLNKVEERMIQSFGFKNRHMLRLPTEPLHNKLETSESLGIKSTQLALEMTSLQPEILVHGTTTSSRYTGSQATAIAGNFNLTIPAYEIKAGCSTGLAGLHMAYSLIQSGYTSAICTFSETLSKVADIEKPESWFGLADGSASLFLQKSTEHDKDFTVLKSLYFTDGQHIDLYSTQGQLPPLTEDLKKNLYTLRGDAEALRQQALRRYSDLISATLSSEEKSKVRWILCHQVNRQLVRDVIEQNQLAGDPFWINHEYGNMGGATIPFSISMALENKLFKSGDLIFLMSVGGGISAAAQLWQWN